MAPPVPKDFKRSSHLYQIFQKSVNDEQYEIYKGPGSDGHVTSNLRIKALRVRLNCKKMIQWKFEIIRMKILAPTSVERETNLAKPTPLSSWVGVVKQFLIILSKTIISWSLLIFRTTIMKVFTRPLLQKGSSLQEEILSVCLFVCLSVRNHFFLLRIFIKLMI